MRASLIIIIFLIFLDLQLISTNENVHSRVKRKVVFVKNSKFFMRLNIKSNIIPWFQFYAVAFGFRINWDLPEAFQRRHLFYKRDIHEEIAKVESKLFANGYNCILKEVCSAITKFRRPKPCKMFCGITSILLSSEDKDGMFLKSILDKCEYYFEECPHSLNNMMPFIEL